MRPMTRKPEPNLESGANIDCCKLYRDNYAVSASELLPFPPLADMSFLQEYERIVRESIREQLGL